MIKFRDYLNTILQNDKGTQAYIEAALESFSEDHDEEIFLEVLKSVINAKGGITKISKVNNMDINQLNKIFKTPAKLSLDNIMLLLSLLGFKLKVSKTI